MHIHIYIYMCIQREMNMHMYMYMCMHMYRFASKKLHSRFLLASLELPPKSCAVAAAAFKQQQSHEMKACGLVLYWRQ